MEEYELLKSLRIGNYIRSKSDKKYYKIVRLDIENDINITAEPIPLTEEILLKFGFYKSEISGEHFYFNPELLIKVRIEDGYWEEPSLDVFLGLNYITCIEFVHELQNLIFALTKEELKINL